VSEAGEVASCIEVGGRKQVTNDRNFSSLLEQQTGVIGGSWFENAEETLNYEVI
jgi:hypothetical protein